jgi:nucleotide-binding universal stress UspA family protein
VIPVTFTSRDFASDISRTARLRHVDLILMGFHHPVYTASILGGTVHRVMTGSDTDVAIFVDRGSTARAPQKILVPYMGSKHDRLALELAGRMARNRNVAVTVLHISAPGGNADENRAYAKSATDRVFNDPTQPLPVTLRNIEGDSPVDLVVEESKDFDLVVIGVAEEWGLESQLLGFRAERIAQEITAPLLIVRKHGNFHAARGLPPERIESPRQAAGASA